MLVRWAMGHLSLPPLAPLHRLHLRRRRRVARRSGNELVASLMARGLRTGWDGRLQAASARSSGSACRATAWCSRVCAATMQSSTVLVDHRRRRGAMHELCCHRRSHAAARGGDRRVCGDGDRGLTTRQPQSLAGRGGARHQRPARFVPADRHRARGHLSIVAATATLPAWRSWSTTPKPSPSNGAGASGSWPATIPAARASRRPAWRPWRGGGPSAPPMAATTELTPARGTPGRFRTGGGWAPDSGPVLELGQGSLTASSAAGELLGGEDQANDDAGAAVAAV
jgi:hypothetical protein